MFAGNATATHQIAVRFFPGVFSLHSDGLFAKSADMLPIKDAMCAFTKVQGRFNGLGEWVEIVPVFVNGVEV